MAPARGCRCSAAGGPGLRPVTFRMVVDSTPCVTIWHKMATDGTVPTRFAKDWLLTVTSGGKCSGLVPVPVTICALVPGTAGLVSQCQAG
jgi:hypothetical protein